MRNPPTATDCLQPRMAALRQMANHLLRTNIATDCLQLRMAGDGLPVKRSTS
jgi:hypothetical protein